MENKQLSDISRMYGKLGNDKSLMNHPEFRHKVKTGLVSSCLLLFFVME